jgi:ABC-type antimicrobial peptide transport system permease subunit
MNQLLPDINLILEQNIGEIDLCKYALSIEGILTKPAQYYMIGNNNQMKEALIGKGMEIVERIGLNTNSTMTAPLVNSVEQLGFLRVFLTSSMSTVVFFLAILSIQLIYSLMVSDVDEKTYQYGMLRALGFK